MLATIESFNLPSRSQSHFVFRSFFFQYCPKIIISFMTRYCFLAVAALVANCGCVCATSKPALLNPLPRAVVTLNLQPISLIYETPVLVSLFALQNTEIVLGNHLTVKVTNAPTSVNTVVTKTCYGCTTESRYAEALLQLVACWLIEL